MESTCHSQAERLFQRHDDPDSEDRHNGEKRKGLEERSVGGVVGDVPAGGFQPVHTKEQSSQ